MPTEIKDIIMEAMKMALEGEWEGANKLIVTHTMHLENKINEMEKTADILKYFIEQDIEVDS